MNHSIGVTLKFADFAAGGSDHPRTPPGDRPRPVECPDELWSAGLEASRTVIGPGRDPRQYAPEMPVAAATSPMYRFLAFTGRGDISSR